jgi:ferredoxin
MIHNGITNLYIILPQIWISFISKTTSKLWIKMPEISLDHDTCINCKTCISICPMGVFADRGDYVEISKPEDCIVCMGCVPACPVDAISVRE